MPADPIFYSGILRRFLTTKVLQSPSFGKKGKMSFLLKSSICKYARTYLVLLLPPIVDSKKRVSNSLQSNVKYCLLQSGTLFSGHDGR